MQSSESAINCTLPASSALYFLNGYDLLCRPAKWTDIAIFLIGNYIAHVATVRTLPKDSTSTKILLAVMALFFPTYGIVNAFNAIFSGAAFADTELQKAARAGALCTIIKSHAFVSPDDVQNGRPRLLEPKPLALADRAFWGETVNGAISLPRGWTIKMVARNGKFENGYIHAKPSRWWETCWKKINFFGSPDTSKKTVLAGSSNVFQSIFALVQALYATYTLYQTRGDQIDRYGFAAYGLTVAPYAYMSFLNLISGFFCPSYSSLFLVESEDLHQLQEQIVAEGRQSDFFVYGSVGKLEGGTSGLDTGKTLWSDERTYRSFFLVFFALGPLLIVGLISRFELGSSTPAQQVWTLGWLIFGMLTPFTLERRILEGNRTLLWFFLIINSIPSIGGFIYVRQMISSYGVCIPVN